MDLDKKIDANKYIVDVTINNNWKHAELNVAPLPYEPPPPTLDTNFVFGNCKDPLARHVTQDVVGTKLNDSYYRPCLPNEGPQPSGCTPREIWRPCWPPHVNPSGKESRSLDKIGSTWASHPCLRDHEQGLCTFNRDWVLQAGKASNHRRAGKLAEVGGSLLFPGRKIYTCKHPRRPQGKNVGDILPRFRPRRGDIYVKPCINTIFLRNLDPKGYVGFVNNSYGLEMDGGLMVLRILKFRDCTLRTRKRIKLFLLNTDHQWNLKGALDTYGYLEDPCNKIQSNYKIVPVRYRTAIKPNTCDLQCIPQRGDLIIRGPWNGLFPSQKDHKCCLMWWRPRLELDLNDILVRACVWHCCDKFEAFVDLYYYNGRGIRWVFLGRDEIVFETKLSDPDSGTSDDEEPSDTLEPPCR